MFVKRLLGKCLEGDYAKFPVIGIFGPRQSGKTTLARHHFHEHHYVSFEDPATRSWAATDPRGFLRESTEGKRGLIIDEFQYVPEILSYIQLDADEHRRPGFFVITGSQNFLMDRAVTQSLAGRIGILTLLPLSLDELASAKFVLENPYSLIVQGFYPRIYAESIAAPALYSSYIHTYIERDVRQLINVGDIAVFQRFLALCAGRVGQLLNMSDLADSCGISLMTVKRWLSVLEASYIIFLLEPYFNNFNKRKTKTPKLYFFDTGIACSLLGIDDAQTLALSPFKGPLFENFIIADLYKQFLNRARQTPLYFWRDKNGRLEIDCVITRATVELIPIEIKPSETIAYSTFFAQLTKWNELSGTDTKNNYVVYGGDTSQTRTAGKILSWRAVGTLVDKLFAS